MKRKRLIIPCVIIAVLVVCAALWYTRPVSLSSYVSSPQSAHVVLIRCDEKGDSQYRSVVLEQGSDDAVLEQLSGISFRRSLLNPLRALLPEVVSGTPIDPDQQDFLIHLTGDSGSVSLQSTSGSWSYAGSDRYFPCSPVEEATGASIMDLLWEQATPVEPTEIN